MLATLLQTPNPFWDPHILDLFDGIKNQLDRGAFVGDAKKIAAVLSIIYLSVRAYAMILGEQTMQITQLFRPFVITLVILNFGYFAGIMGSVGNAAENRMKQRFKVNATATDRLMKEREDLIRKTLDIVEQNLQSMKQDRVKAEFEKYGGKSEGFLSGVDNAIREFGYMLEASLVLEAKIQLAKFQMVLQNFIADLTLSLFKGVAYCMFFIQLILMHIMLILGPISFAFSIAGPFSSSWVEWTKRFVAISFYGTITCIVLNISLAIVQYGFSQEISRLTQLTQQAVVKEQFLNSIVGNTSHLFGFLVIALLTAIGGIMQVPMVAGWVLSGGTGEQVMFGAATGTAKAAAAGGMRAGKAVASGGAGVIGSAGAKAAGNMTRGIAGGIKEIGSTIGKSIKSLRK